MARLILFNKPFDVLSQFTDSKERSTLATFLHQSECRGFYPAGRLDRDSEGLLILTNDGLLQNRIADPAHKLPKTYWAQVEGSVDDTALRQLRLGVDLKDGTTRPAKVETIEEPIIWPRTPPIRARQNIPTQWIELTISEGKNRQVRRMTAAVGLPTLRLVRASIGPWRLHPLAPGEYRFVDVHLPQKSLKRGNNAGARR